MYGVNNKSESNQDLPKIVDLPSELLYIILKYVNENHQTALVCKKFNEIISNIESKSKILVIKDDKFVSKLLRFIYSEKFSHNFFSLFSSATGCCDFLIDYHDKQRIRLDQN